MLSDAGLLVGALVVAAAGLARVVYLAGMAELLVSDLQHLYQREYLVLLGLVHSAHGEQEVGEVGPLRTAGYGVDV